MQSISKKLESPKSIKPTSVGQIFQRPHNYYDTQRLTMKSSIGIQSRISALLNSKISEEVSKRKIFRPLPSLSSDSIKRSYGIYKITNQDSRHAGSYEMGIRSINSSSGWKVNQAATHKLRQSNNLSDQVKLKKRYKQRQLLPRIIQQLSVNGTQNQPVHLIMHREQEAIADLKGNRMKLCNSYEKSLPARVTEQLRQRFGIESPLISKTSSAKQSPRRKPASSNFEATTPQIVQLSPIKYTPLNQILDIYEQSSSFIGDRSPTKTQKSTIISENRVSIQTEGPKPCTCLKTDLALNEQYRVKRMFYKQSLPSLSLLRRNIYTLDKIFVNNQHDEWPVVVLPFEGVLGQFKKQNLHDLREPVLEIREGICEGLWKLQQKYRLVMISVLDKHKILRFLRLLNEKGVSLTAAYHARCYKDPGDFMQKRLALGFMDYTKIYADLHLASYLERIMIVTPYQGPSLDKPELFCKQGSNYKPLIHYLPVASKEYQKVPVALMVDDLRISEYNQVLSGSELCKYINMVISQKYDNINNRHDQKAGLSLLKCSKIQVHLENLLQQSPSSTEITQAYQHQSVIPKNYNQNVINQQKVLVSTCKLHLRIYSRKIYKKTQHLLLKLPANYPKTATIVVTSDSSKLQPYPCTLINHSLAISNSNDVS